MVMKKNKKVHFQKNTLVDPVVDLLKKVEAIYIDDHFVYTSGMHGSVYINKDAMYQHPQETTLICRLFAERFQDFDIDVVVGPAVGGIVLAQWTAYHLTQLKGRKELGVFKERMLIKTKNSLGGTINW